MHVFKKYTYLFLTKLYLNIFSFLPITTPALSSHLTRQPHTPQSPPVYRFTSLTPLFPHSIVSPHSPTTPPSLSSPLTHPLRPPVYRLSSLTPLPPQSIVYPHSPTSLPPPSLTIVSPDMGVTTPLILTPSPQSNYQLTPLPP